MKKKCLIYIFIIIICFFIVPIVWATTIRETVIAGDGYDTIEPNTFIIGVTKFSGTEVITASKASIAGAHDALVYASIHGTTKGYVPPVIYYYVDANVGWFEIDNDNNVRPVLDQETLAKLASMDIYYVNNVEKKIGVSYNGEALLPSSLGNGVSFEDGTLYVDATIRNFELKTENGRTISFFLDDDTNEFVEDKSSCFTIQDGYITNYDKNCGPNVTVPKKIYDEDVIGIRSGAFQDKDLESVVIPNTIQVIEENAFTGNPNLTDVTMEGKYDTNDFENLNQNAFDNNTTLEYDNDLTKILNSLPDSYEIPIYSGLDFDSVDMEPIINNAVFKTINSGNYSFHIESSEIDKFYMIHYYLGENVNNDDNTCYDHKEGSFDMYFFYDNDGKYQIALRKMANNCTRIIDVHKELKIVYQKTGSLLDKLSIDSAFSNLEKEDNPYSDFLSYGDKVSRRADLEDFVDNNNLEYLFSATDANVVELTSGANIGGSITGGTLYLFRNDILYRVIEKFTLIDLSRSYYPDLSISDYNDEEAYIDAILNDFTAKTQVSDYTFMFTRGDSRYSKYLKGSVWTYYIGLFDKNSLEYWSIYAKNVAEDQYDANGYTLASCFTTNEGVITKYDGNCGANVRIPNIINGFSVIEIGANVFDQYGLLSVTLPNSIKKIGSNAFSKNQLTSIQLPASLEEIGWSAFENNKITSLIIPSNVQIIQGHAFQSNQLNTLSIPNTLSELGDAAFTDNQLVDSEAFIYRRYYDSTLDEVVFDTTKINSYAGKNRHNIIIPSSVKQIGTSAFQDLLIDTITIPYGITSIESYAFYGNKLTKLSIPDTVEYVGWGAFSKNKFQGDNCFIYTHDRNNEVDKTVLASYSFYQNSSGSTTLDELVIPNGVKKIWSNAFTNGFGIYVNDLILPDSIEEIGDYAFSNVYFTNQLAIPIGVKKIGLNTFARSDYASPDTAFIFAKMPNGTIDNSVLMAYAGDSSYELGTIAIPDSVKIIRENVFNSKYFTNIVFNNQLETIGEYAFANMYNLRKLSLPTSLKTIKDHAFEYDSNLSNITLNEGLETIGEYAFYNHYLFSLEIPNTVKTVGDYAFYNNFVTDINFLNSIVLHDGITSIGAHAFQRLANRDTISIPRSVTTIGDDAFGYVRNVKIYGKNSLDEFDGDVYFNRYPDIDIEFINE